MKPTSRRPLRPRHPIHAGEQPLLSEPGLQARQPSDPVNAVFSATLLVELYPATHPRLDHGYAVTSHSSQGQIADAAIAAIIYR